MYKSILSLCVCLSLFGCDKKELESLRAENLAQKTEIQALKDEVANLRQTAEYNFRLGQDYLAAKNWDFAIESFSAVIKKYPESPLVVSATEALSIAEAGREKHLKENAEKQRIADEERERELEESGEPIDYGEFYAKSKAGMKYGKRYRFYACLPQSGCIINQNLSIDQNVCGVEAQFDSQEEYESWLSSGETHCGTIVASMLRGAYGGTIVVHRLH